MKLSSLPDIVSEDRQGMEYAVVGLHRECYWLVQKKKKAGKWFLPIYIY